MTTASVYKRRIQAIVFLALKMSSSSNDTARDDLIRSFTYRALSLCFPTTEGDLGAEQLAIVHTALQELAEKIVNQRDRWMPPESFQGEFPMDPIIIRYAKRRFGSFIFNLEEPSRLPYIVPRNSRGRVRRR